MGFKSVTKKILSSIGFEVSLSKYSLAAGRRSALERSQIVIDVGANIGQFAEHVRSIGYNGQILSFEPCGGPYSELLRKTRMDSNWTAMNYALGSSERTSTINRSVNSTVSSLFVPSIELLRMAPSAQVEELEEVRVLPLDDFDVAQSGNAYLKIDTQGTELDVLLGAKRTLSKVDFVECELSTTALYEHQSLFAEVAEALHQDGFRLTRIERTLSDSNFDTLQFDALFAKRTNPPE